MTAWLVALAALSIGAKGPQRIAVLDVKPRAGISEALAQGVSDSVVSEVRKQAGKASVISSEEIRGLLALERQRQQLGCENVSCLAEIGGALGAQQMVTGSLSLFGDLYVLTLKRVDVAHAQVLREAAGRLDKSSERNFPDVVARLCRQLFGDASAADPAPPPPDLFGDQSQPQVSAGAANRSSHTLGWVFTTLGIALAGVAIGTGVATGLDAHTLDQISNGNPGRVFAPAAYDKLHEAQTLEGVAIGTGVAALLSGGAAALSW